MKFYKTGIVYNQTWEDFEVDKKLLNLGQKDTLLTITSGGCNVLNACLENPKKIFAIDSNPAQNHLLKLKIAGIRTLDYREFWQFFGEGKSINNIDIYNKKIRGLLPEDGKIYWDKNIKIFKSGIFSVGSLGALSLLRKYTQRLCSVKLLKHFTQIDDTNEQAQYYIKEIEPRLWTRITSHIPTFTMVLYGTHLRQIFLCYKQKKPFLKDLYKDKQHFIFTKIPVKTNFFWHFIFYGKYLNNTDCPNYLKEKNFLKLKKNIDSIVIYDGSIISFLGNQKENSITKFSISDIIEFSRQKQINELWKEIIRTAQTGSAVSYRSFAPNIFPPQQILKYLEYSKKDSEKYSLLERTGSYGNIYKYTIIK